MKNQYAISFSQLLEELTRWGLVQSHSPEKEVSITNISYNSKEVTPGTLFFCKGMAFRPEYLDQAVQAGACCYLAQTVYRQDLPYIQVTDIRKAMSVVCILFYNRPFEDIDVIGITGTKGKTSTSYFMDSILRQVVGRRCGLLSTVEIYTGETETEAHLTTPEAPDLERYFAETRDWGLRYLTMEVSSQAYKMERTLGVRFKVGVFLNIGLDHISPIEHENYEDYLSCKLKLMENCDIGVIYRGTKDFERVWETAQAHCKQVVTFGEDPRADVRLLDIRRENGVFVFSVEYQGKTETYTMDTPGRFNVENALAAITVGKLLGFAQEDIAAGIRHVTIPGRMNLFEKDGAVILVDYAHNELSFTRLYESLVMDYPGWPIKVLTGSPGGHAYRRRQEIGTLSGKYCSHIYLTEEDPQFEDVVDICREMATYIEPFGTSYEIIPDRTQAVEKAVAQVKPGEVLVIAGKSEEDYQKVRGQYVPYESDLAIVRRMLQQEKEPSHS